ncbi:MAG: M81 family metallopeptidase [Verrucomicrobiales bacterium]
MKRPRVLVAGLFHETHTFLDENTPLENFERRQGEDLLACEGDSSPLGGALEAGRAAGWEIVPGLDVRALPGGPASRSPIPLFDDYLRALPDEVPLAEIDAVFLVLHGAMVDGESLDVEGALLERIRTVAEFANLPLFAVIDLHANVSNEMARRADALFAYRENPHTDARETAVRAARALDECLRTGEMPRIFHRHTGIVWPPTGTGTADEPMASLEKLARRLEEEAREILSVNVVPGFAYADTPDTGLSFQVVVRGGAESAALAGRALDALAELAEARREQGLVRDASLADVLPTLGERASGPTILVEPSDNIGAGAPGDGTGCFRALLEHPVGSAAVCLWDPAAVQDLAALEPGQRCRLSVGGKGSRFDPGPVEIEGELVSRSDGRFRLEDSGSHLASLCGDYFDMGPSAVVRIGDLLLLLTTNRTPPFDLGQWRSQGIRPEDLDVIVVKAAVAHRRAYDPIAARSFTVDTPGPCRSDLSAFAYRNFSPRSSA